MITQVLVEGLKHSTKSLPDSVRRTTAARLIALAGMAKRKPPLAPRTVEVTAAAADAWKEVDRWPRNGASPLRSSLYGGRKPGLNTRARMAYFGQVTPSVPSRMKKRCCHLAVFIVYTAIMRFWIWQPCCKLILPRMSSAPRQ